ncbi:hypothetical protein [Ktedonospora formicarum]|uniref:Uncharacterized protein n=1 Tax=Ktedonospora formicarum TaxID=2778364 RepID=A0A8J3I6Y0_9CHLR|nr:hypothetical protein [Ktedonospora formicarum]GHO49791.1 hypothetical protein KSX_79540 [Ktedonospora formicarum]
MICRTESLIVWEMSEQLPSDHPCMQAHPTREASDPARSRKIEQMQGPQSNGLCQMHQGIEQVLSTYTTPTL